MKPVRSVIVFDAADLHAESTFWAGMLDGHVFDDETFHTVIDAAASGASAFSSHPNTLRQIGRTARLSKCTSTSTSTTRSERTNRQ